MQVSAQFLRIDPRDLQAGEDRVLRVTGLGEDDAFVYLDARANVSRIRQGSKETSVVSWQVEQVLHDMLDPHEVG